MRAVVVRILVVVAASLTVPAVAGPTPKTCRLVVDPRGDSDQTLVSHPGQEMDPSLDILSADVASDPRSLTAVLRLDDLGELGEGGATLGKVYDVWFSAGEDGFGLGAVVGAEGQRFRLSHSGGSTDAGSASGGSATVIAEISGIVDVVRDEVRMTAPLSAFAPYYALREGDQLYDLAAGTWSGLFSSRLGAGGSVDFAYGKKAVYPVHGPSCVRVGG